MDVMSGTLSEMTDFLSEKYDESGFELRFKGFKRMIRKQQRIFLINTHDLSARSVPRDPQLLYV